METVQQLDRAELRQGHHSHSSIPEIDDNIVVNAVVRPFRLREVDWARVANGPAAAQAECGEQKNVRVDGFSRYSEDRRANIASRSKESVGHSDPSLDRRPVVYVVGHDVTTREWLATFIDLAGWRCELCACIQELLSLTKPLEQSCVLVDLNLADQTGLDLQMSSPEQMSELPVVFLSCCADVRVAVQAMKGGAIDFLIKPCGEDALAAAIRQAFERSRKALDGARVTKAIQLRRSTLSRREDEVMTLVVTGLLNKQIGFELGISEITVKAHRGQVMRKMEARSLAGLVTMAGQIGLTTPAP